MAPRLTPTTQNMAPDEALLLAQVVRRLGRALTLKETVSVILEEARRALKLTQTALWLFDPETRHLELAGVLPSSPSRENPLRAPLLESDLRRTLQGRRPQVLQQGPDKVRSHASYLALPLRAKGPPLGLLLLGRRRPGPFTADELRQAKAFAKEASFGLARIQLLERARHQTITDQLTGLLSHPHLWGRLEEELKRATRSRKPVTILFLDLDHFKLYNELNGFSRGDLALREVGRIIRASIRGMDQAARFGGEEFVAILPETDPLAAVTVAERIRREVARFNFPSRVKESGFLTVSIGLASYPQDAQTKEGLVGNAELAMRYAKQKGGSQMRSYHAEQVHLAEFQLQKAGLKGIPMGVINALAAAIDAKDPYTHRHSHSVASLSVAVAERLGLQGDDLEKIRIAGLLHDVGKIGVPDQILNKPGKLTAKERQVIERHPEIGEQILRNIPGLEETFPIVLADQEFYDGEGYPQGLKGEEIPIGARIVAAVDAYHAMVSDRPYRKAMPRKQAIAELRRHAGSQFDPRVVEVLVECLKERLDWRA